MSPHWACQQAAPPVITQHKRRQRQHGAEVSTSCLRRDNSSMEACNKDAHLRSDSVLQQAIKVVSQSILCLHCLDHAVKVLATEVISTDTGSKGQKATAGGAQQLWAVG